MERKIRAWNRETHSWMSCKSIEYDHNKKSWRHRRTWADGSEDWMYDVEVCVNDVWLKMNNDTIDGLSAKQEEQNGDKMTMTTTEYKKITDERRFKIVYLNPEYITTLFNLAIEGNTPHEYITLPQINTGEPNCIVVHNYFDHSRDCYAIVIGNKNFDPVPIGITIPSIDYELETVKIPVQPKTMDWKQVVSEVEHALNKLSTP
jgi:hypothetical protein